MVKPSLRDYLGSIDENTIVFDNPSFDNSIVGFADGSVVYSLDLMIEELMQDDNISYEDALDFIEYNTMRAIPYFPDPKPVVITETIEQGDWE